MSKTFEEIAGDITQAVIQTRGQVIAQTDTTIGDKRGMIEKYLSDEAIVKTYHSVFKSVKKAYNE